MQQAHELHEGVQPRYITCLIHEHPPMIASRRHDASIAGQLPVALPTVLVNESPHSYTHIPFIWIFGCIGLIQQLCVLHDFCHLLQHAVRLHDEERHTHQICHIHANEFAKLTGLEQQLADLRLQTMQVSDSWWCFERRALKLAGPQMSVCCWPGKRHW